MATNNGAWRSDTAGTATLIVFNGVSAANDEAGRNSSNAVREIRIVHRFMGSSFFPIDLRPDYPKQEKMSSLVFETISMACLLNQYLSPSAV